MINELTSAINNILCSDIPIELVQLPRKNLIQIFTELGLQDKVDLLKFWHENTITCIKCDGVIDYTYEPHSLDKNRLKIFEIRKFYQGFLLRFPNLTSPNKIDEYKEPKLLHQMITEYNEWVTLFGIDTVPKLNEIVFSKKIDQLKFVAESLHEKKLFEIADKLCSNFSNKRIISIAGPSSSNKTTFAKRLALSLKSNGFSSLVIEMDDFFHNLEDIPHEPGEECDWESIECLNVKLIGERVNQMLLGETVPRRKYDWTNGVSYDDPHETMRLEPNSFLILEGIHGLNPQLLNVLGKERVTPIYVQALSPLKVDLNHRFPCSDLRLIRRLIRDYLFRGSYPPRATLERWTSVRLGEMNNIFPYQEKAEIFFNSSLFYEVPVLGTIGKGLLMEASLPPEDENPESPVAIEANNDALRLLKLISFFHPLTTEIVPHISCICEFIGGSDLKY
ncbi:Phosphoribulokinase / Uridine kinase family protein [Histomonas meleagridis]|uniref:Phosphoribulokinase / Uridine kinase family protein n=1 Tax=Histomonas meleagridis TaxID=135588 RepID=UPI00355ACD54|nr:Phosphoribulokinase / Uridine kinase family protein [Histomonas meleagridis]KAH0805506.1 Phosphoribulokinase / Uridine kinase family protein [Histomonas meleagridis]